MPFDYTRIRRGEWLAAGGAIALFIVMFLPWYNLKGGARTRYELAASHMPPPLTGNAWSAYSNTSLLLVLLIIVALSLAVVTATQQRVNFPLAIVATLLAVLVLAEIVYKLFGHRPGGNTNTEVAYGAYLGLLAIIIITIGAPLTALEDGMTWRDRPTPAPDAGTAAAEPSVASDAGPAPSVTERSPEPEAPQRADD